MSGQQVEAALHALLLDERIVEGGFRPGGVHREWCDAEVLRLIRRKSLARLRKEVEPVEQQMLARLQTHWQGVLQRRRGLDALLDTIENLQGTPLPASLLEIGDSAGATGELFASQSRHPDRRRRSRVVRARSAGRA